MNWASPLASVAIFLVYVATSCAGLYMLKAADNWKTASFAIGFILYGMGAAIWLVILRLMPLSIAFPIAAGALIVGTLLIGGIFLGENITVIHITGTILIMLGIVLVAINR